MQFAGALPELRNYSFVYTACSRLTQKLVEKYSFLITMVENENIPLLKLAFKCGWRIMGVRMTTDKKILVELINSRKNT